MRFDEAFAKAYGTGGFDTGMELGLKKWLAENDPTAKAALQLKIDAEARRAKEGAVRTDLLLKKQAIIDSILSGGGIGNVGGNFPAGTTFSIGGVNMPLNRKYSEGESKTLSQAGAFLADLNELKNMYETGKATGGAQALGSSTAALQQVPLIGGMLSGSLMGLGGLGPKGETRQNFSDLIGNVSERLLRLRSGAQINEAEYRRFMRMMPSFMRGDKLDVKQLNRFIKEFEALQGRIESGALWDKKQKKFVGGEKPATINLDTLFSDLEAPTESEE